jgi:hAT family C-terminal dimerisation region
MSTFPNVGIVLKLYLTLPVSKCEGERSFSTLSRIKNHLRTSICQNFGATIINYSKAQGPGPRAKGGPSRSFSPGPPIVMIRSCLQPLYLMTWITCLTCTTQHGRNCSKNTFPSEQPLAGSNTMHLGYDTDRYSARRHVRKLERVLRCNRLPLCHLEWRYAVVCSHQLLDDKQQSSWRGHIHESSGDSNTLWKILSSLLSPPVRPPTYITPAAFVDQFKSKVEATRASMAMQH